MKYCNIFNGKYFFDQPIKYTRTCVNMLGKLLLEDNYATDCLLDYLNVLKKIAN